MIAQNSTTHEFLAEMTEIVLNKNVHQTEQCVVKTLEMVEFFNSTKSPH